MRHIFLASGLVLSTSMLFSQSASAQLTENEIFAPNVWCQCVTSCRNNNDTYVEPATCSINFSKWNGVFAPFEPVEPKNIGEGYCGEQGGVSSTVCYSKEDLEEIDRLRKLHPELYNWDR